MYTERREYLELPSSLQGVMKDIKLPLLSVVPEPEEGRGKRVGSHLKGVEMLVVSLSGLNYGFWYPLGCRQYFSPPRYLLGLHAKN